MLLFPPFKDYQFGDNWSGTESLIPPLGLLYLAAPLIKAGYDVSFIDLCIEKFERKEFFNIIAEQDFILISCLTQSIEHTNKLIKDIKRCNSKAFVLCGGPYCREIRQFVEGSDLTVMGEAEEYIVEIIQRLSSNESLEDIPELIFRENGGLKRTENKMIVSNLDEIEPPLLDLIKVKNYGFFQGFRVPNVAPIMTSRGCLFKCIYCTNNIVKYRERSVNNVILDIKKLEEQGYEYLIFCDDNFLLNRKRVLKIMNKIIENKIKMKMIIQGRVDGADYALYRTMRKAGVITVIFGIESVNQDVLDFYNKRATVEANKKAIEIANKAGMITVGNVIIGSPIETRKHLSEVKTFSDELPLDFLNINILAYFYSTPLWKEAREKGLIRENDIFVLTNEKTSNFSLEELYEMEKELLTYFYKNPKRILRIIYKIIRIGEGRGLFQLFKQFFNKTIYRTGGNRYGFSEQTVTIQLSQ